MALSKTLTLEKVLPNAYDAEGKASVDFKNRLNDKKPLYVCREIPKEQPDTTGYDNGIVSEYTEHFVAPNPITFGEPHFSIRSDGYNPVESNMTQEDYSEL